MQIGEKIKMLRQSKLMTQSELAGTQITRNMLSTCLFYGYNGRHTNKLNTYLRKAGDLALLMQSVTGELAYGGRSNQFLHNEAHLTVCFEYEATARKFTDPEKAGQFKAADELALSNIDLWLNTAPGQHIKNFFPNIAKNFCYFA